ncbi:MAG: hypothetical protein WAU68_12070 [Vitreimonas sp.]
MPMPLHDPSPGQRLDFVLPKFMRVAWVDDRLRAVWEPRLFTMAAAWREIERLTVVEGVRACAIQWLAQDELDSLEPFLTRHGVRAVSLASNPRASRAGLVHRVAIGPRREVSKLRAAWMRGDDETVGQCLGYPACCRTFFHRVVVEEGWLDPTWPRAREMGVSDAAAPRIDLVCNPECNLFWEPLGIRPTSHLACSHACEASRAAASSFAAIGVKAGLSAQLDLVAEVLHWPVEWTALHGIAETKTPIVKLSTRTDATPAKLTLRYLGDRYPSNGARGGGFPYAKPRETKSNKLKITPAPEGAIHAADVPR